MTLKQEIITQEAAMIMLKALETIHVESDTLAEKLCLKRIDGKVCDAAKAGAYSAYKKCSGIAADALDRTQLS